MNQLHKIIVIGGSHYNTLGLIKSLGKIGYQISVILEHCDLNSCGLRFSKYISKLYHIEKLSDIEQVLLDNFGDEQYKPIILCASDASICYLDKIYSKLRGKFHLFNCGDSEGGINHLMEKINTFPYAQESGFDIIKTIHTNNVNNLPDNFSFPCLIKGNSSVTSKKTDMFLCKNKDELLANFNNGVDYLVQEYIDKDYEIDVVGFSYNHGANVVLTGAVRKIRDDLQRQSVYIELVELTNYSPKITEYIKNMLGLIKYDGIFSVEILGKADKLYFLEINLRNDGNGYLYTAAGANYPLLWVKYCEGTLKDEDINQIKIKTPFKLMQLYDIYNVVEKKVSPLVWLKQAITADAHYVFDVHDIKPFLFTLKDGGKHALMKISRKLKSMVLKRK